MVWRCLLSTEAVGSRSGRGRLACELFELDMPGAPQAQQMSAGGRFQRTTWVSRLEKPFCKTTRRMKTTQAKRPPWHPPQAV